MSFQLTNTQVHVIPHTHPTSDIPGLVELIEANAVIVSPTAPANPTAGKLWYNTTKGVFNIYNGSAWILVGPEIYPITKAAYDALPAADKNDGRFYLITDNDGTIIVDWANVENKPYYISATAPDTPAEGNLWYDSTNDILKVYDGTNWNPVNTFIEYQAGQNIQINPTTHEISATDTTYTASDFDIKDLTDSTGLRTTWSGKQDAINDLSTIRSGAAAGATAVQPLDNVSGLTNDAGYITNAVSDLTNYYTKTQTYTKSEVDQMIADFGGFEVVEQLPAVATANTHIIYLLGPIGTGGDRYEEWIVTTSEEEDPDTHETVEVKSWTKIGETSVDLSNYFNTFTDTADSINNGTNHLFVSPSEKSTWNAKQDVLTAGSNITIDSNTNTISASVNTKTFPMAVATKVADAQAAIDWVLDGNNALIKLDNRIYLLDKVENGVYYFKAVAYSNNGTNDTMTVTNIEVTVVSDTVTEVHIMGEAHGYLETNRNYATPFVPTQNGHPATKKYVDDSLNAKISAGTTSPSNPTEGQLWYDTTNDVLKVYDGTDWNTVDVNTTYTAGNGISISNDEISIDTTVVATKTDLSSKQDTISDLATIRSGASAGATAVQPNDNVSELTNDAGYITSSALDDYSTTTEMNNAISTATSGLATESYVDTALASKQDTLTAGANIQISNNVISATDTTYTAGTGIDITNGVISNTQTSAEWGNITGTLSDQTDLQNALDGKQDTISDLSTIRSNATAGKSASDTIATYGDIVTHDVSEFATTAQGALANTAIQPNDNVSDLTNDAGYITNSALNGYATESYVDDGLADKADTEDIPTKTSDLTNDSGFITNAVNDLVNYYTKTQTYSKTEVDNLISSFGNFEVVASLPSVSAASEKTIYLLGPIGTGADKYEEWIVTEDSQQQKQWTKIGETSVDLSGYATTTALTNGLATKQDTLTASDGIDIDGSNNISVDVTDIIGTGLSEDASNNIIVDTTVVATQTDLSGKQDKATSGSTAPSTTPSYVGQQYIDTTADKMYVATGTSSSSDWTEVGSGGGGGGSGDMQYSDFNWVTKTGASITLDLNSYIEPSADFTVNAPATIKDGQVYVLRVATGLVPYTMTLGTNITNPYSEDITLTTNTLSNFSFVATGGNLELQPSIDITGVVTGSYAAAENGTDLSLVTTGEKYIWGNKETKPTSGSGAPSIVPAYVGQRYFRTSNSTWYVANGTSAATDWVAIDTNTTYSAGTGLTLSAGNQFAIDTSVVATQSDLASRGFEVVSTLPSVSTASEDKVYILGPIGTGADKYEEYIVTEEYGTSGTITDLTINANDADSSSLAAYIVNANLYDGQYLTIDSFSTTDTGVEFNDIIWDNTTYTSLPINYGEFTVGTSDASFRVDVTGTLSGTGTHTITGRASTSTWGMQKVWTKIGETSIDLSGKQDKATSGSTAPSTTPSYVGQQYVDTTNNKLYVATGTTSSSDWTEVGAGSGDMLYADFNWVFKTGATAILDINSIITPSANFTVNAPSTIKDGQVYILRVVSGPTAYTMTLGTGITNPYSTSTTLTANGVDQFVFQAIGGDLELLPDSDVDITGKQDKATTGTAAPSSTPTYVGQSYVNTSTTTPFVATGTSASTDWQGIPILSKQTGAATNVKIWVGTQAAYEALSGSYDANTLYFTTSSS